MQDNRNVFLDKIIKFLGRLKLSFILLLFLGLLVSQRAIMAQRAVLPKEGTELPLLIRILNSLGIFSPEKLDYLFYIVLALFVLNLGFAGFKMVRRVRAKQRIREDFKNEESLRTLSNNTVFPVRQYAEEKVAGFLKRNGFRVHYETVNSGFRLRAQKHGTGQWGVLLFHLTFLILLIGIILSITTRYSGYAEISPGETFIEKHENYLKKTKRPPLFGDDKLFKIELEDIDLSYWGPGVVKQRANIVNVYNSDGVFLGRKRMEINRPLKVGGVKIYQGTRQGFIAGLEITDSENNKATGTVRFRVPEKPGAKMLNRINLSGTGLDLELELFTEKLGEIEGLEQLGARHMATLLKVTTIEGHRRVSRGVVFYGSALSFEGLTVKFRSLKPYTSFVVVRDYGVPVIFAGFVFLLFGLVVTYFWVPENYWAVIKKSADGDYLVLGATTEKYKGSFKNRFDMQVSELKKEVLRS